MLFDLFGKVLEMSLIGCYVIAIVLVKTFTTPKLEVPISSVLPPE